LEVAKHDVALQFRITGKGRHDLDLTGRNASDAVGSVSVANTVDQSALAGILARPAGTDDSRTVPQSTIVAAGEIGSDGGDGIGIGALIDQHPAVGQIDIAATDGDSVSVDSQKPLHGGQPSGLSECAVDSQTTRRIDGDAPLVSKSADAQHSPIGGFQGALVAQAAGRIDHDVSAGGVGIDGALIHQHRVGRANDPVVAVDAVAHRSIGPRGW